MSVKVLSDIELRSGHISSADGYVTIDEDTIITPAARDYLRTYGIRVNRTSAAPFGKMSRTHIETRGGEPVYIDSVSGRELREKPEDMTHLRGNLLVPKNHPQILFRGKLDSLSAEVIAIQAAVYQKNMRQLAEDLEEILTYVRKILGAEVKNEELEQIQFLGMNSEQIRYHSHHIKEYTGIDHPIPDYRMGEPAVSLNRLRTVVRDTELSAAAVFRDAEGKCTRPDILEGLNRLSSCVYILFCRTVAGYYR